MWGFTKIFDFICLNGVLAIVFELSLTPTPMAPLFNVGREEKVRAKHHEFTERTAWIQFGELTSRNAHGKT